MKKFTAEKIIYNQANSSLAIQMFQASLNYM